MFSASSGAARWPTMQDCGCTGQLPGVNVYSRVSTAGTRV
uniref:Uncharacterized protein n=1 Tax=Anguilla anguilla TaxID=7936 RepID=A0A0E9X772_ANGAN